MEWSKSDLFERAKNGNIEAFEELIEGHQKKVYAALSLYKNKQKANDLAQQVFVRAFKELGSFNGEVALLLSIYRATAELCTEKEPAGGYLL